MINPQKRWFLFFAPGAPLCLHVIRGIPVTPDECCIFVLLPFLCQSVPFPCSHSSCAVLWQPLAHSVRIAQTLQLFLSFFGRSNVWGRHRPHNFGNLLFWVPELFPFTLFLGEGFPTKKDYRKKLVPLF